jgi:hypothetical protein
VTVVGRTAAPVRTSDTLLVRLDRSGSPDWMRHVGGPGAQRGKAIAVAPDGSIAFGGDSVGALTVDGTPLAVPGQARDAWLSHWSPAGRLDWSKAWGGPGDDIVKGLACGQDAVFAVGGFTGTVDVDGTRLDAGAGTDLAVVRFSPGGTLGWATSVGADGPVVGTEITSAADGGILFGSIAADAASVRFGSPTGPPTPLDTRPGGQAWLVHYRPDGSVGFAATIPGTADARPGEIARSGPRLYLDIVTPPQPPPPPPPTPSGPSTSDAPATQAVSPPSLGTSVRPKSLPTNRSGCPSLIDKA